MKGLSMAIPAAGTKPSIEPSSLMAFSKDELRLSCFVTSVGRYNVLAPNLLLRFVHSASSTGLSWMSITATFPPISQMARVKANPMPCAPPVTT